MKKSKHIMFYLLLLIASLLFLFFGNRYVTNHSRTFAGLAGSPSKSFPVRVDMVLSEEEGRIETGGMQLIQTRREFSATVMYGAERGNGIIAVQRYDTASGRTPTPLRAGDWVLVYLDSDGQYYSGELVRLNVIILVAAVFFLMLIVFGKLKGLATIVSLLLSVCSIFLVFIPAILSGRNIYAWALIICVFSVAITPFFIGGFQVKSLSSMLGSLFSVGLAAVLTALLNTAMRITGGVDDDTLAVSYILDPPIDLRAVVFAAIIIGALGATIDVSMSIASSVSEMRDVTGDTRFSSLLRAGMNIGRDIMGAQTSTLVMAYIGGSLSVVLLLVAYQNSFYELLNLEFVIIELMQALIGGFTILFAIPGTALIAAAIFARKARDGDVIPHL